MTVALHDVTSGFNAFRPPKRVTVAEGAAENYVIKQPGGYTGPWSADETPYMVEPMNMLASRRHEAVCYVGPARGGKCLDVDTPIATPDGWSTMGDLVVGGEVFGPDGNPTTILSVSEIKIGRPCYEVAFSDGSTLIADDEHRWGVERFYWKEPNWRYEVRTTAELIEDLTYSGGNRFRYRVRNTAPLILSESTSDLDPYMLGVWIGDGTSSRGAFTFHEDDVPYFSSRFGGLGFECDVSHTKGKAVTLQIDRRGLLTTHCQRGHSFTEVGRDANGGCKECRRLAAEHRSIGLDLPPPDKYDQTFVSTLRRNGLIDNKHIPAALLRGSEWQRAEILRGWLDADGYADPTKSRAEITIVPDGLKDDFLELARSLGLKPSCVLKKTTWTHNGETRHGEAWRIAFPIPSHIEVFSLPRKAEQACVAKVDVGYRQIVSIKPVTSRPVRCIAVDNESHLFLAGRGFVPTHNTASLVLGWMSHIVCNDPGDLLILSMTQDKARELSKTDIDRAIRHSPNINRLMGRAQDDNTHDKMFNHGMWMRIAWPTVSNVSGSTYRYVVSTDYDRVPDDIDGEGSLFGLGLKRTQTFLSRGMCAVESSPGRELRDPHWRPATPHEAPPTTGILGIYNRSDRRRYYWQCPDCDEFFEAKPGLDLFKLPSEDTLLEIIRTVNIQELAVEHNRIVCPHCGALHGPRSKHTFNKGGIWVPDGQIVTPQRELVGEALNSSIAGYWQGGVTAAYQSWLSIISRYLMGLREYALSGSELSLINTINTDQAMPYMPKSIAINATASDGPRGRKTADYDRFIVPQWARFLLAAVDIQGGKRARFVVEVHAIGPDFEQVVVDRYTIGESLRKDDNGDFMPIRPGEHPEDWDVLTERVVKSTYRIQGEEGKELRIRRIAVDSGGEDGVTAQVYDWYRRIRRSGENVRVTLVKGANTRTAPLIKETLVGAKRKGETGDIPLYLVNPNLLKDAVMASIRRPTPGPGYLHIPDWLPEYWFDELEAETRSANGMWVQIGNKPNETLDLNGYIRAMYILLGCDKFDWEHCPSWAKPLDRNSDLITREERRELQAEKPAAKRGRRVSRSSYLSR
jgi:phage terminase large subunit GpA-like protein